MKVDKWYVVKNNTWAWSPGWFSRAAPAGEWMLVGRDGETGEHWVCCAFPTFDEARSQLIAFHLLRGEILLPVGVTYVPRVSAHNQAGRMRVAAPADATGPGADCEYW